ncbi:MAG: helix-turn-helix domain-containing protein [Chloroflexi bacterium]|nr:helix-turn-helix domain-containing protein [Chloroflexota bacterium]
MRTEGGAKLRALREASGLTQLEVELEASLGTGYLQRVECGRVQQPERETLDRILTALRASFVQRRDLLAMFGYTVAITPPSEAEIAWAVQQINPLLEKVGFPAYLLDCAHHLLTWNSATEALFSQIGVHNLADFQTSPIFRLFFDQQQGILTAIHNATEFLPALIEALRHEISKMNEAAWCNALINHLVEELPLFKTYWLTPTQLPLVAARPLVPFELVLPTGFCLKFRITAEPMTPDPRFRLVYYLPADASTLERYAPSGLR